MLEPSEVGQRVRAARQIAKDAGCDLSARDLGWYAGVSESLVGHLESGRVLSPKTDTLVAIADVLGVSIEWLATGNGEPPNAAKVCAAIECARARKPRPPATGTDGD